MNDFCLTSCALEVLQTADPWQKAHKTHRIVDQLRSLTDVHIIINSLDAKDIPDRPARPEHPILLRPGDMPRRKKAGSKRGKIALLHALAHIELNAIDLAWDMIARYAFFHHPQGERDFSLPVAFYTQWADVAYDEAKHFLMLCDRLSDLEADYGDLPAHDGLWESAYVTKDDFAGRLAVVPMVLEARGLDVTPMMVETMHTQGDDKTANLLQVIHDDEIGHVAAGTIWFEAWCDHHDLDGQTTWQALVNAYFKGRLKRPFNHVSREKAGLPFDWYDPLAEIMDSAGVKGVA